MTVAEMVSEMTAQMTRPRVATPDATAQMAGLQARIGRLRALASLEASHSELQQAAQRGELVCWHQCRLRGEDGSRVYEPGEAMPAIDAQDSMLRPEKRLVTTRARWESSQEFKKLSGYWQQESRITLQMRHKHARAAHEAATSEIARLESALKTTKNALREATATLRTVEGEMRSFVEAAPN